MKHMTRKLQPSSKIHIYSCRMFENSLQTPEKTLVGFNSRTLNTPSIN